MKKLIYLFLILALMGCSKHKKPTAPDPPPITSYTIKYDVRGTAGICSISYTNATGDVDLIAHQHTPWNLQLTKNVGDAIGVCAFGEADGSVIVSVYKNNVLLHSSNINISYQIICVDDTL
jgi:hypothetical protein